MASKNLAQMRGFFGDISLVASGNLTQNWFYNTDTGSPMASGNFPKKRTYQPNAESPMASDNFPQKDIIDMLI